jgi:hypothetical protein
MSPLVSGTESLSPVVSTSIPQDPLAAPLTSGVRTSTGTTLAASEQRWQVRLLPLMSRMIVGLTVFFFAASLGQLIYLDRAIERVPATDFAQLGIGAPGAAQRLASPEFRVLASLDAALLERKYHQANVFLMGRLWTSYLGFVTGMILALVGAVFILGKMREDASELNTSGAAGTIALRSSSPGIILATLGVVLMITTIVTNHPIQTADAPVFVGTLAGKPALGTPTGAPVTKTSDSHDSATTHRDTLP